MTATDDQAVEGSGWIDAAGARLAGARRRCLGFPVATDIDFTDLLPLHAGFINNIGDPETAGRWRCHTKDVEQQVIATFVRLFGGSTLRCWGYVTGGGATEGVTHGMWLGLERYPTARVYHSTAAHYSIPKGARLLRADTIVPADPGGEMRYDALTAAARRYRDRPALVVATAGTTMTEAVDDLASIHTALTAAGITDRFVVVDAALAGPALALSGGPAASWLAEHGGRHRADADSICFSSHKSFGTPHVSGVALTRRRHLAQLGRPVDYLASTDTTISGSRSGHAPLELHHVLQQLGLDGLRDRARAARRVAAHTVDRLTALGWPAWRHPHAWTVVLPEPPAGLAERWQLATSGASSHIVCAPGITTELIDEFVAELAAALNLPRPDTTAADTTGPNTTGPNIAGLNIAGSGIGDGHTGEVTAVHRIGCRDVPAADDARIHLINRQIPQPRPGRRVRPGTPPDMPPDALPAAAPDAPPDTVAGAGSDAGPVGSSEMERT
jgi:histidine decarboxylase